MEELFVELLKEYSYPILFVWSIMEGELGLIMAGLLSHTGDMNLWFSIAVASLGGFAGDQIYFWFGRYNRAMVHEQFRTHRRKFALATLLIRKHGWYIIFIQRYMYGMRTILPMAIGTTKVSGRKFAVINFLSAIIWASMTIVTTYIFGAIILDALKYMKAHWYLFAPLILSLAAFILWYFHKYSQK